MCIIYFPDFARIPFLRIIFYYMSILDYVRNVHSNYMVDSHESDAFGPYFGKAHFFNIQNKQRLYLTHSEAPHLHLINS